MVPCQRVRGTPAATVDPGVDGASPAGGAAGAMMSMSMTAAILSVAPAVRFATRVPAPPRLRRCARAPTEGWTTDFQAGDERPARACAARPSTRRPGAGCTRRGALEALPTATTSCSSTFGRRSSTRRRAAVARPVTPLSPLRRRSQRRAAQRGRRCSRTGAGGQRDRADGTGLTVVALTTADAPPDAAAYVIVGPANGRPHRAAAEAQAAGTPCVLVNLADAGGLARWLGRGADAAARAPSGGFTTAFELVPLSLQRALATTDDYVGEGAEQRTRGFNPEGGAPPPLPTAVSSRRRLGRRLRATATLDRRPGPDEMLLAAGDAIKRKQAALKAAREDMLREDGMLPKRDDDDGDALAAAVAGSAAASAARPRRPPRRPRRRCACSTSTRCSGSRCRCTRRAACCGSATRRRRRAATTRSPPASSTTTATRSTCTARRRTPGATCPSSRAARCCALATRALRVEQLAVAPDRRADGWGGGSTPPRPPRAAAARAPSRAAPPLTATRMLLESLGYAEAEPGWLSRGGGGRC